MTACQMNSTWQMRANQPSAGDSPSLHDARRCLSPLGGCVESPATHTSPTPSSLDTVKAFRCCGSAMETQADQDGLTPGSTHLVPQHELPAQKIRAWARRAHFAEACRHHMPGDAVIGSRQTWHTGAGPAPPIGPTPLFPTHDGAPPHRRMAARGSRGWQALDVLLLRFCNNGHGLRATMAVQRASQQRPRKGTKAPPLPSHQLWMGS
ncbi:hypothetical protein J3F84DRAFT_150385 [Trichoderma pleuroticola]